MRLACLSTKDGTERERERKAKEERRRRKRKKVPMETKWQRAIGLCHIVKFYFDLLVSIYFAYAGALFTVTLMMLLPLLLMLSGACLAAPL